VSGCVGVYVSTLTGQPKDRENRSVSGQPSREPPDLVLADQTRQVKKTLSGSRASVDSDPRVNVFVQSSCAPISPSIG